MWFGTSTTLVEELSEIGNIGFQNRVKTCYEVCVRRHSFTFIVEKEHQDRSQRIGRPSSRIFDRKNFIHTFHPVITCERCSVTWYFGLACEDNLQES